VHCKLNSVIIHRAMIKSLIIPILPISERLDQVLAKLLPDYSRTQIQAWIEAGDILVNGKVVKAKTKVQGGETVEIDAIIKPQPTWAAQAIKLNIVYEDEALLVINKPAGLVVHPGAGNQDSTLLNALLHHAEELKNLPRAGILHRLDKDSSGLLVIAKTAAALKDLSLQLKKRAILREYQTIVYGRLISGGTIDAPIDRHPIQRKRMAIVETGKKAITHYRVAEKYRAHTLLKVRLETGRTHQIRVHMMYMRHPIIGDSTYGGRVQLTKQMQPELIQAMRQLKRQALHAVAIGFVHPVTQKEMYWESELPQDMQQLIQLLREDTKRNRS